MYFDSRYQFNITMKFIYLVILSLTLVGCVSKVRNESTSLADEQQKHAMFYINELKSCPLKFQRGVFLDGGTIAVRVHYSTSDIRYFGIENSLPLEVNNSSNSLTDEDYEYIASNKEINVFLGVYPGSKGYSQVLPFKGSEELALRTVISKWSDCEQLDNASKQAIEKFISDLDGDRTRGTNYLFDAPNEKLLLWRQDNSRKGIFGEDVKNEYITLMGLQTAVVELSDITACDNAFDCDLKWYKFTINVKYSREEKNLNKIIYAVRKDAYKPIMNTATLGIFVLSEIPIESQNEALGSKYYLHEIAWPKSIYCFNSRLSDIGIPKYDTISYRAYDHWEMQCISAE
ncbi:hypothetical protein FLL45_13575 [Aliikangiella marina]|uniref:Uncharacterized protein n=1 Tax=Aliikangiella marina TaxID=1712262 RepID=A0A545T9K6_9GAMM|nr:hypothetical protein [Aliikangiella marina]TQV73889.1 hypothetical protein FLL45_13575 [Aliikangiella marina]